MVITKQVTVIQKAPENIAEAGKDKHDHGGSCKHAHDEEKQAMQAEVVGLKTEQKTMESKLEQEFASVFGLIEQLTSSFMAKFEKLEAADKKRGKKGDGGGGMTAKEKREMELFIEEAKDKLSQSGKEQERQEKLMKALSE